MKKTGLILIVLMILCATVLSGCSGSAGKTTIYLLNWGEYMDPDVLAEFNASQDEIVVKQTTTTSNEEMYTTCSTEGSGVDMVVPSEYMIDMMKGEELLAELNLDNIPNFKYVEAMASTSNCVSNDDSSKYIAVPYMCGTLGIIYNTTMVDDPVTSWDILWNEKYANKVMMYDSVRDSLAVALMRLGYSVNSRDSEEIAEAGELLVEQKSMVLAYGTDDIKDSMISGSVAMAMDYSGGAIAAISENPDLEYVVPEGDGNIWADSIAILKTSEHQEACEKFINYLCDPEISARNSEYIGYPTPNTAALEYVSEDLKSISGYIIDEDTAARCTYYEYLGDALQYYDEAWTKVKASSK